MHFKTSTHRHVMVLDSRYSRPSIELWLMGNYGETAHLYTQTVGTGERTGRSAATFFHLVARILVNKIGQIKLMEKASSVAGQRR